MNLNVDLVKRECANCGSKIHNYLNVCIACNEPSSPPNIFACSSTDNIKELKKALLSLRIQYMTKEK